MKAALNLLRRLSLTSLMVLVALWAGYRLWDYYMQEPWTRDGHVRADVVPIAPDVSGFVTEVLVDDNEQVQRGDVLFRIDRARYEIALKQAEALLAAEVELLEMVARGEPLRQILVALSRNDALTVDIGVVPLP